MTQISNSKERGTFHLLTENLIMRLRLTFIVIASFSLILAGCGKDKTVFRSDPALSKPADGYMALQFTYSANGQPVSFWEKDDNYIQCLNDLEKDENGRNKIGNVKSEAGSCITISPGSMVSTDDYLYSVSSDGKGNGIAYYVSSDYKSITQCTLKVNRQGFFTQPGIAEPCKSFEVSSLAEVHEFIAFYKGPSTNYETASLWYDLKGVNTKGVNFFVYPHEVTPGGMWWQEEIGLPQQPHEFNIRSGLLPKGVQNQYIRLISFNYGDGTNNNELILTVGTDNIELADSDWYKTNFPDNSMDGTVIRCLVDLLKDQNGLLVPSTVTSCEYAPALNATNIQDASAKTIAF